MVAAAQGAAGGEGGWYDEEGRYMQAYYDEWGNYIQGKSTWIHNCDIVEVVYCIDVYRSRVGVCALSSFFKDPSS